MTERMNVRLENYDQYSWRRRPSEWDIGGGRTPLPIGGFESTSSVNAISSLRSSRYPTRWENSLERVRLSSGSSDTPLTGERWSTIDPSK